MYGFIVAGIGTGVGKTICSSILVEKLAADYWKPVQAGGLEDSDTMVVKRLVSTPQCTFHPEAFRLSAAMSPHAAANRDGVAVHQADFDLPETQRPLIVELAGGLHVPLSEGLFNIDLIAAWQLPVILISQYYLGSINHTLLSIEALQHRQIPIRGVIFNGETNTESREIILATSGLPCLLEIAWESDWTRQTIRRYARELTL